MFNRHLSKSPSAAQAPPKWTSPPILLSTALNCLYLCVLWKWVCKCVLEEVEYKYFNLKKEPQTNQICVRATQLQEHIYYTFGISWSNQTPQQQTKQSCGQGAAASAKPSAEMRRDGLIWSYGRVTGSNLLGSTACVTWKECSVAGAQSHTAATVIIQVSIETTSASCAALEPQKPSGSNLSSPHSTTRTQYAVYRLAGTNLCLGHGKNICCISKYTVYVYI